MNVTVWVAPEGDWEQDAATHVQAALIKRDPESQRWCMSHVAGLDPEGQSTDYEGYSPLGLIIEGPSSIEEIGDFLFEGEGDPKITNVQLA